MIVSIYNRTRARTVSAKTAVADTALGRLAGLLGKSREWAESDGGLWILPSQGIHTFGMRFPIDVVFLDAARRVLDVQRRLRPFRISRLHLSARSVLELPPGAIDKSGTQPSDELEIAPKTSS
ncbi:MAG: DUF192 domain-containing protein [Terriglobia bacterium]